jgi:hypothetical protein
MPPTLFAVVIFWVGSCGFFAGASFGLQSSYLCLPAQITKISLCYHVHLACWDEVSLTFCLGSPWILIFPISFWVAGIASRSHGTQQVNLVSSAFPPRKHTHTHIHTYLCICLVWSVLKQIWYFINSEKQEEKCKKGRMGCRLRPASFLSLVRPTLSSQCSVGWAGLSPCFSCESRVAGMSKLRCEKSEMGNVK